MNPKLILIYLSLLLPSSAGAQLKVEIDIKATEQMAANTAIAEAIEKQVTEDAKEIRKMNDSIAVMTGVIQKLSNVYHNSMQNARGWGRETQVYKSIYNSASSITSGVRKLLRSDVKSLARSSVSDHATRILARATGLLAFFMDVAAKERMGDILDEDFRHDDGYNFLSAKDRYEIASRVSYELRAIDTQLKYLLYAAGYRNSTRKGLLKYVDDETYRNYQKGQVICGNIRLQWDALKKKLQ